MSDGELLEQAMPNDSNDGPSNINVFSGHVGEQSHANYYIWKEPPRAGQPHGKSNF